MKQSYRVHAALLTVALIYGANYSIAKTVTPEFILPFGVIVLRVVGATILFWFIAPKERIENKKDLAYLALCSLFGVAINQLCFFKGLSLTVPVNASVIMTIVPIMVLLATTFLLKERLTQIKLLGIFLGFVGAVMLVTGGGFSFSGDTFLGDIFILINALAYGVYLVIAKPMLDKYKPLTVVKWIFTFGCLFVVPMGYPELRLVEWGMLPSYTYVALAYIIVFTTCLTYLLNAFALKKVSPNIVGYYIYLQPIIATTIAIIFRGDTLTIPTIVFSCLIFLGVYLVSMKRKPIPSES